MSEPKVDRPVTEPGYGIPESLSGMLSWDWVQERMSDALIYWVASVRPDARPHVTPIWGAWVDDSFWMEGGPNTRRFKNLAENPAAVVTIERGDDAIILEGDARRVYDLDEAVTRRLLDGYAKYRQSHDYAADPANWKDGGIWRVSPRKVLAWSNYPQDATRWTFE
jgi:hypothetical protein